VISQERFHEAEADKLQMESKLDSIKKKREKLEQQLGSLASTLQNEKDLKSDASRAVNQLEMELESVSKEVRATGKRFRSE